MGHTDTRHYLTNSGEIIERMRDSYMNDVRKVTTKLIDLVDDGVLSWETVAMACLSYMSEDHVADMAQYNYLIDDETDEAGE